MPAYSFDWDFYKEKYPDLYSAGVKTELAGFLHFITKGFVEGRQAAPTVQNTNFDWQYYTKVNNLKKIKTEQAAHEHYRSIGKTRNLPYCKIFTIGIFLHIYNLELIDEIVEKVNYFMKINVLNNFYIKINIPLGNNIHQPLPTHILQSFPKHSFIHIRNTVLQATPYHKQLITDDKVKNIFCVLNYLKNKLELPDNKIQVIFSENRGLDVGGFFLLLDQAFKQNLSCDYIVKIHTKSNYVWRTISTSFLNLRINKILHTKKALYACKLYHNWQAPPIPIVIQPLSKLFNYFNLPKNNFSFPAGTMFIASSTLINFFKPYDRLALYNMLTPYTHYASDYVGVEHGFEWLFGYLITHLNLKSQVLGYIPRTTDQILKQ